MINFVQNHIWITLLILNYIIALTTAVFIIFKNRNPVSTLSYIMAIVIFPYVGLIIYFFFGQEYRKDKMFKRKMVFNDKKVKKWEKKLLMGDAELDQLENQFLHGKIGVVKLLQNDLRKPLTKNDVTILKNGESKFKALFEDIKNAKNHIHLEYYILNDDKIGSQLIDLVCRKAKEGIEVRISYDYVASQLSNKALKKIRDCGVEAYPFMKVWFPNLTRKLNYRDHRKIAIIDGKIGYVGGINVCDDYINPNPKRYWRDMHLRIEGQAVKSLQTHFILIWDFVSEDQLDIQDNYFPEIKETGNVYTQIAISGPDSNWPHIMEAIFTAINSAEDYIYITTPYFIPNDEILTALKTASRRGLEVKLLVPKDSDSWAAKYATNSYVESLLDSGIEIYHYCKGMIHAKTMVIDGIFSTIGTCNMDYRSFEINFEVNALLYDKETAEQMVKIYEDDLKDSKKVDYDLWMNRSWAKKAKESFNRLWAPLL